MTHATAPRTGLSGMVKRLTAPVVRSATTIEYRRAFKYRLGEGETLPYRPPYSKHPKSLRLSPIWALDCTVLVACAPLAAKYEAAAEKMVTGREMKALTGLAFVVAATFNDLTFTEPAMLLLSGGLLLGLAGAVRRITA